MSNGSNHNPSADHWSVDFVDHLRSVHFALAILSLILIVLALPPDERLSVAYVQAAQLLDLQQHWADLRAAAFAAADDHMHLRVYHLIEIAPKSDAGPAKLEGSAAVSLESLIDLTQEHAELIFAGGPRMATPPQTLGDFRRWWDNFAERGLPVRVFNLWDLNYCEATLLSPNGQHSYPLQCTVKYRNSYHEREWPPSERAHTDYQSFNTPVENWSDMQTENIMGLVDVTFRDQPGFTVGAKPLGSNVINIAMWASLKPQIIHSIPDIVSLGKVGQGSFDKRFAELMSTPQSVQNGPLADLPSRVAALQVRGERDVDIFGLMIPVADLTRWGTVFILSLQLYYWLHLHELRGKLSKTAPGRDVAWIGIYKSKVAFGVVIASSSVLPFVSVTMLTWRAVREPFVATAGMALCALNALPLVVGLGLAVVIAIRTKQIRHTLHH